MQEKTTATGRIQLLIDRTRGDKEIVTMTKTLDELPRGSKPDVCEECGQPFKTEEFACVYAQADRVDREDLAVTSNDIDALIDVEITTMLARLQARGNCLSCSAYYLFFRSLLALRTIQSKNDAYAALETAEEILDGEELLD